VWKVLGYNMVLLLVGLKNIPAVYYEARALTARQAGKMFRQITLPLLRPILLFVVVISTINAYNVFTQVYVMTRDRRRPPGRRCACWCSTSTRTASSSSDGVCLCGGGGPHPHHTGLDPDPDARHRMDGE